MDELPDRIVELRDRLDDAGNRFELARSQAALIDTGSPRLPPPLEIAGNEPKNRCAHAGPQTTALLLAVS